MTHVSIGKKYAKLSFKIHIEGGHCCLVLCALPTLISLQEFESQYTLKVRVLWQWYTLMYHLTPPPFLWPKINFSSIWWNAVFPTVFCFQWHLPLGHRSILWTALCGQWWWWALLWSDSFESLSLDILVLLLLFLFLFLFLLFLLLSMFVF